MDSDRGIGKNNDLMWHLPKDMKFFKDTTQGQIVVMGRKNYDSIPEKYRPLPNRLNVVLTRNENFEASNCLVFHSLEECLTHFKEESERIVFIIGGGEIYKQALGFSNRLYITQVKSNFDSADTYFPKWQADLWSLDYCESHGIDETHKYAFDLCVLNRKSHLG